MRTPALKTTFTKLLRPVQPLVRAGQLWSRAGGLTMSAAMSFYGILSLALKSTPGLLAVFAPQRMPESAVSMPFRAALTVVAPHLSHTPRRTSRP